MIAQHLKYPFDHTIIYNHFSKDELSDIFNDMRLLQTMGDCLSYVEKDDLHHQALIKECNLELYNVDRVLKNSKINLHNKKLFAYFKAGLLDGSNFFLNYLPLIKHQNCYLNIYRNASFYPKHQDDSVLTALYLFWRGDGNRNGGDFVFTEYDYSPHLENNCCIIFPSFVLHEVTKLNCEPSVSRISINQRFSI